MKLFRSKLSIEVIILGLLVTGINQLAVYYYLYWTVNELDSLVHFLGGVFVSLFFVWLYYSTGLFVAESNNLTKMLLISLLGLAVMAVVWEIYELLLGEALRSGVNYISDTILDFIMDFLGGLVGVIYGYMRLNNSKMVIENERI